MTTIVCIQSGANGNKTEESDLDQASCKASYHTPKGKWNCNGVVADRRGFLVRYSRDNQLVDSPQQNTIEQIIMKWIHRVLHKS